jgi:hypothetical protein
MLHACPVLVTRNSSERRWTALGLTGSSQVSTDLQPKRLPNLGLISVRA